MSEVWALYATYNYQEHLIEIYDSEENANKAADQLCRLAQRDRNPIVRRIKINCDGTLPDWVSDDIWGIIGAW